jgi:hypothetical protein
MVDYVQNAVQAVCINNFCLHSNRVETKMFVFVFSRKFVFAFREKSLPKVKKKITKVFAKTFALAKIFAKNDAGSENAMKHPNFERQTKFRS